MARKMHCTLQEIGQDSPKVSVAGTDSVSTIHQQQNKVTSFQDCEESSVSSITSDSGCAVLTFLNFDPDGNWRIVAVPVRCLSHINLASGVHMDGLQLLFPPPVNRLKIDQCKGPRGPLSHFAYPAKSFTRRNVAASNVHRRCQNKIAKKASKLNELKEVPGNSCSQSSLVCSPSLVPDNSATVSSSDKVMSNSKEDKPLKKNSRKRARKKVRQSKKQSSDSGSTEREVLNEEYVSVSLTSETSSSNDVDKDVGLMLYTVEPELSSSDDRLVKDDCERNEISGSINVTEAPESCNPYINEAEMSKDMAPIIQNSATFDSKNQLQDRGTDFTVPDRETKDIQHVDLCRYGDIPDSLVLDSGSVGSNIDTSTKAGDIGKQSNKASSRITSKSGDGYFLDQNVMNGIHNNSEHNEGVKNGGQSCITNDKRAKQKRPVSKSSSFNKFSGFGIPHSRTGKENSHSVWQKVQKNGSDECSNDLKKVNTALSQFDSSVQKDPSVIRKCSAASVNVLSKTEDKKHTRNKVGRKSKVKVDLVSKKGQCSYSRKGSQFNMSVLNDNVKDSVQQYDISHVSSQENSQQELTNVSGFSSDINSLMDGFQTNIVEQVTSESVNSSQFRLWESDPQKNVENENIEIQDSSMAMPCENVDQSNMHEEQSPVSYNHLGAEAGQMEKEVSYADYNAQSHSSGTTLWKWIPIGKKDTGLAKCDYSSLSPDYSDAPPSKKFNLESNVEPKGDSFSQNPDSSLNVSSTCMDQVYCELPCSDEGGNITFGNEFACTVTEGSVKHDSAQMIYECEDQDTLENDSYRIAQAVNDACRVQLACEAVHMATGSPIVEIERLLHFCSPVVCQSPNSPTRFNCSRSHGDCVSLCAHEIPDLSLGCLWQWYEKHGSYGLEIRAQDFENPKRLGGGVGQFPFRAYFVPSLSAVQLFKNRMNQCVNSGDRSPDIKVSEACEMVDISEHSPTASQHPIFSVLFPQPRNQDTNIQTPTETASINNGSDPSISSPCSSDLELLYEYFELEQPQQRQPLYEKIQDLVGGDIPIMSKTYGDPTILESISLRDLHPRSWFAVAWYPIYRIPDGNFRSSFLTYHSLGHLVRRSTNSDSLTVGSSIVSPVVGLQSYNTQGECWFQLRQSAHAAEMLGLNPSLLLKERLRTLEESASLMAKAVVNKGNQICTNRHPDYEFFLSRRRY